MSSPLSSVSTQTESLKPSQYQQTLDQLKDAMNRQSELKAENSDLAATQLKQTISYNKLYESYSKLIIDSKLLWKEKEEIEANLLRIREENENLHSLNNQLKTNVDKLKVENEKLKIPTDDFELVDENRSLDEPTGCLQLCMLQRSKYHKT